ncbi:MAG: HEPN domain-containing protein [Defluviitaleaceae bacterium]|nr:HEPN domain-containing protein [Defluviitaleaceae bacterium]
MAEIGSYLYIAKKDLSRAKIMHAAQDYSAGGRFSEQSVEKCLKAFIEQNGISDDYRLMSLHKPRRLYERCLELGLSSLSDKDICTLSQLADYYYDTNYPGNAYFELTKAQSQEALELAEKVVVLIEAALERENEE